MATDVFQIIGLVTPDNLADEIVEQYTTARSARSEWEQQVEEIRAYVTATDTRTTTNNKLPFKNSTTIPKLASIASNLIANYSRHAFGSKYWVQFEAYDKEAALAESVRTIEAYVRHKVRRKDYVRKFKECLTDWVYSGVCFAQQRYVTEYTKDQDGVDKPTYQGSVLERLPSQEVAFDVTASSFEDAWKIVRKTYNFGQIAKMVQEGGTIFTQEMLDEMFETRALVRQAGLVTPPEGLDYKNIALSKDGLGSMLNYVRGDAIEVHEFYGDYYSMEDGKFYPNHKIVILDRRKVIYKEPITSLNGSQHLYYSAWESRPDNLMGMSPLARIVGMQYKLDKLENLRADVFDKIANPPRVERGVLEFTGVEGAPGAKWVVDEQGDVREFKYDATVLQADFQMQTTMNLMEEMAGSPRMSAGFRTPGEKTKFEVQILDQGANLIFRDKVQLFETEFVEKVLEDIVELGRSKLSASDLISLEGDTFKATEFLTITRDDLFVNGKIRAIGSRIFVEKANALQNIINMFANPTIAGMLTPHTSRKKLYEAFEELLEIEEYNLFLQFIGLQEDFQAQKLVNTMQTQADTTAAVAGTEPLEPDITDEEAFTQTTAESQDTQG